MRFYLWIKYIRSSKAFIQFTKVLCFIPSVVALIFSVVFLMDTLMTFSQFAINEKKADIGYRQNYVVEIASVLTNNESYILQLISSANTSESFNVGDKVCSLYVSEDGKNIVLLNESVNEVIGKTTFITIEGNEIILEDGHELPIATDVNVCDIYLSDVGFIAKLSDGYSLDKKEFDFLKVGKVEESGSVISFIFDYTVDSNGEIFAYVRNLPKECLYYDTSNNVILQNIPKDYYKTFILKSNALVVFTSTVLLYILVIFLVKFEYIELDEKSMRRGGILFIVVESLFICTILFALVILSGTTLN